MTAKRVIDDHLELANIGIKTHAEIDDHIADPSAHHVKYTDAEAISATENLKYGFSVYRSGIQNIGPYAWTKVEFNTKNFDIHNDFSTATHNFVAPVNGYYILCANITYDTLLEANKALVLSINLNGVGEAPIHGVGRVVTNATVYHGISLSLVQKMAAGDYACCATYSYMTIGSKRLYGVSGYTNFSGGLIGEY